MFHVTYTYSMLLLSTVFINEATAARSASLLEVLLFYSLQQEKYEPTNIIDYCY